LVRIQQEYQTADGPTSARLDIARQQEEVGSGELDGWMEEIYDVMEEKGLKEEQ